MPKVGTILIGVLLFLLLIAGFIYFNKRVEGFATDDVLANNLSVGQLKNYRATMAQARANGYRSTGAGASTRDDFLAGQKELFNQGFNKSLFTNSELQKDITDNATAALATTDTFGNTRNAALDLSVLFEDDPFPGLDKENKQCANVLEPQFMPPHEKNAVKGCGWWYVDADDSVSIGALGTEKGPLNSTTLNEKHKGGVWIWDIREAQKKEDVKRCRKVKSCDVADLVPGKCGFCPGLNRGVPVNNFQGVSIYQDDPELNCGTWAITSPSNCPRPKPEIDSDGQMSNPSSESSSGARLICDPNPATGQLSTECLMSLASAAGCQPEGAIIIILKGDSAGYLKKSGANSQKFAIATEVLRTNNSLAIDLTPYGKGVCTRSEALNYYTRVIKIIMRVPNTAEDRRSEAAARFLVYDATIFNECEQKPDDMGPYPLHCLEREAREQGWQPAGSEFPTKETKDIYDNMTWGKVLQYFRDTVQNTKSDDFKVQAPAVKKSLGISITPPEADCGDRNGLSMYMYQWNYDWRLGPGQAPKSIYYGRISSPTFPEINNNGSFTPFNIGTDRIHMRIKTLLKPVTSLKTRFWVMTDDGITISDYGGRTLLSKLYDQGPTSYESNPTMLQENTNSGFVFDWYNNYGGYVAMFRLFMEGKYQPIPASMVYQTQPTGFPFARWDFYTGRSTELCHILDSEVVGAVTVETIDGKKCCRFTGRDHIKITNGIKTTAFRSITMTIFINKLVGPWPRPWEFNNNGFAGSWCDDAVFGCMSPNNSKGIGFYAKQGCAGPELWTGANTITVGKWYHIAWVLDDDLMGMSIYIDGARVARYQDQTFRTLINKIYKNMYIFTSVEQFDKDVGVGWFRMFDYPLSADDVQTDRANGWSEKDRHEY